MSTKNFIQKGIFLLGLIFFWAVSTPLFSIQQKIYAPEDLTNPVFNKTDFIIDPDDVLLPEHISGLISLRETYFFSRYVEPVCVRVDNIRNPDDLNKYADKLVELWNLENRSAGRFVLQLSCGSKKKIVYRFGSWLEEFFSKDFIKDLTKKIEDTHFSGTNIGTGEYVSLGALGEQIYKEIAYDSHIITYKGNDGVHTEYPNGIERTWGEAKPMKNSLWQMNKDMEDMYGGTSNPENIPKNYYSGLTQTEIDKNFAAINTSATITKIEAVTNTREINGSHVTDQHHLLSDVGIGMIDEMLKKLEDSLGYQVAVVCLNSIGDNDPHSWGTDLFNLWGIGKKDTENGLLMLLIHDVHAIEFVTGRGTEGILTDGDCYDIQQNEMVPYFKQNDYVTGMIRGTQAVCDFFYGSPPLYSSDTYSDNSTGENYYEEEDNTSFLASGFLYWYVAIIIVFTIAWLVMLMLALFNSDLHKRYYLVKFFTLMIWMFLFPVPFVAIYFLTKVMMERWRNTTRFSAKTGEVMHKLDDNEEDKHLAKGQITEEKVKSIDYDVWVTTGATDILILDYRKWFSKYNKCPKCRFKTYFQVYNRTITPATYDSSGTGERCNKCENCGHTKTVTYTIPRKTRSSSSSGGGGSSSFSGGSSYGGGSSRGGGAGSRW